MSRKKETKKRKWLRNVAAKLGYKFEDALQFERVPPNVMELI